MGTSHPKPPLTAPSLWRDKDKFTAFVKVSTNRLHSLLAFDLSSRYAMNEMMI
jgi:hypothetical protein